jgi:hypothetical protein
VAAPRQTPAAQQLRAATTRHACHLLAAAGTETPSRTSSSYFFVREAADAAPIRAVEEREWLATNDTAATTVAAPAVAAVDAAAHACAAVAAAPEQPCRICWPGAAGIQELFAMPIIGGEGRKPVRKAEALQGEQTALQVRGPAM